MAAHWPRWTERATPVAVVADEGHWQLPAGRRQDWRRLLFRPTEVDFADGALAATNGKEW